MPHPVTAIRPVVLQPLAFPYLRTSEISSLAFSPDGRRLAFGYGTDAEVTLWNLETGKLAWQRHVDAASGGPIQFEPHGRFLIAQFDDPDFKAPVLASTLGGRLLGLNVSFESGASVRLEQSGRFLVASGLQEGIVNGHKQRDAVQATEVWDTRSWRRMSRIVTPQHGAVSEPDYGFVPLTHSGKIIRRLLHKDTIFREWETGTENDGRYRDYPDNRGMRDFAYCARYGASVWETLGRIEITDRKTNAHILLKTLAHDTARMPSISPNGKMLAVPTTEGAMYLWNIPTGKLLAKIQCSTDVLRCVAFSPNSRVLAVAGGSPYTDSGDGIRLVDTSTCKVLAVLKAAFPQTENDGSQEWRLDHPEWLAALPDLSYLAPSGVIKKIRTPGRPRSAETIARFDRPKRVRAALRRCYSASLS